MTAAPKNLKNNRLYVPAAVRCSKTSALYTIHVEPVADGVGWCVKTGPHWFDIRRAWSQGECSLLPWRSAAATYAAGHTSHRRVLHISAGQCSGAPGSWDDLERETSAFVSPDLWPPNSPDLNSTDYKVWGLMQQRVYETKVQNVDDLRQRWTRQGTEQGVSDDAIDEWRRRLRACVQAKGGHFEYSQWLFNLLNLFCENVSITFIVNQHNFESDFRNLLTIIFDTVV